MKERTKKLLLPRAVRFAPPLTRSIVMAAKAAIHALRATPHYSTCAGVSPTAHAEGNKNFFASFFSKKEVPYLPKAARA